MNLLFMLFCCGSAASDAQVAPYAGVLVPLDLDHDGRVSDAEYARVAETAPAFDKVDVDHDGALEAREVSALVLATDPLAFNPVFNAKLAGGGAGGPAQLPGRGALAQALAFEAEELHARSPDATVPDAGLLDAAALAGMDTERGREVAALFAAGGLPLPDALLRATADVPERAPPRGPAPRKRGR